MREKCNQAGVRGEWLDWEKQMHCFPLTFGYRLPEGVWAMEWILGVLERS
jgi:acetyl esterase/lipase